MVNATLTNFSNITSFTTLGQHVNGAVEGYFGFSLLVIFWMTILFATWNKAERSVSMLTASFLSIFWALMLAALGWLDASMIIATVVVFLISFVIAFFQG
jgi:uncharacterized protein YggT (Ycf19 family)